MGASSSAPAGQGDRQAERGCPALCFGAESPTPQHELLGPTEEETQLVARLRPEQDRTGYLSGPRHAVSGAWFSAWQSFAKHQGGPPGPITNKQLLEDKGTQPQAVWIKCDDWQTLQGLHGGGPEFVRSPGVHPVEFWSNLKRSSSSQKNDPSNPMSLATALGQASITLTAKSEKLGEDLAAQLRHLQPTLRTRVLQAIDAGRASDEVRALLSGLRAKSKGAMNFKRFDDIVEELSAYEEAKLSISCIRQAVLDADRIGLELWLDQLTPKLQAAACMENLAASLRQHLQQLEEKERKRMLAAVASVKNSRAPVIGGDSMKQHLNSLAEKHDARIRAAAEQQQVEQPSWKNWREEDTGGMGRNSWGWHDSAAADMEARCERQAYVQAHERRTRASVERIEKLESQRAEQFAKESQRAAEQAAKLNEKDANFQAEKEKRKRTQEYLKQTRAQAEQQQQHQPKQPKQQKEQKPKQKEQQQKQRTSAREEKSQQQEQQQQQQQQPKQPSKSAWGPKHEDALVKLQLPKGKKPTPEELKQAYRKAALRTHPDRPNNQNRKDEATAEFQAVRAAFDLLSEGAGGDAT